MPPRMSPMDRAFFLLETEQRPMNVGVLTVLTPPPRRSGRPSDALVARMLRCPVGAPFNWRLKPGPWPELEALAHVDPAEQLHRHVLPADAGLDTLFARVCELHSRRLDRTRPLWEMHVFDGLARGRVALYFKTHHGLLDGLGFLKVIRATVDLRPGVRTPQAIWRGLPDTSSGRPAAPVASRSGTVPAPAGLVRSAWRTGRVVGDLARLMLHLGRRDLGLGPGLAAPFLSTPAVLRTPPSPNRTMAHCSLPLDRLRAVAQASGAKINDVVLATLDVALSRYLAARGERLSRPLVADMPVALHDEIGAGNRITILQVPLGRPGGTPAQRLADVVRETRLVKDEVRALSADALFFYSIAAHTVASLIETMNLGELPMLANAVVSNPAGLGDTLYFNGLPVELAVPVSVVAHHQVLNVTVSTYGDRLDVTFIALREALPDLPRLATAMSRALLDLQRSVGVRPRRKKPAPVRVGRPSRPAVTLH